MGVIDLSRPFRNGVATAAMFTSGALGLGLPDEVLAKEPAKKIEVVEEGDSFTGKLHRGNEPGPVTVTANYIPTGASEKTTKKVDVVEWAKLTSEQEVKFEEYMSFLKRPEITDQPMNPVLEKAYRESKYPILAFHILRGQFGYANPIAHPLASPESNYKNRVPAMTSAEAKDLIKIANSLDENSIVDKENNKISDSNELYEYFRDAYILGTVNRSVVERRRTAELEYYKSLKSKTN